MKITALDISIIAIYMLVVFFVGVWRTRKAGVNVDSFFLKNRTISWPIAGISMAAANFSIDTPLAITNFIYQQGICGVWLYWSSAISGIIATFFFAQLWRRSSVLTDAEITELRYSGKSASFLRLFKGLYFGVILNVFVLGWVFLALIKIFGTMTGVNPNYVLVVSVFVVMIYVGSSGFFGVINTSLIQYFIALSGAILLAYYSVKYVGGIDSFVAFFSSNDDVSHYIDFFPDFGNSSTESIVTFLTCILFVWWAQKYSDGGGKYIQRILSTKNEKHAMYATLLYSILSYAVQIWPWIITGLCAVIIYPNIEDPEIGYVNMLTQLLPAGVYGIVLASLIAAFMSTVDTHLNLGASYLVNDVYRRFINRNGSDRHYVWVSRVMILLLLLICVAVSMNMKSIAKAWIFILTFTSGAGLTWILRWFWWRINAWSEISSLIASGLVAITLEIKYPDMPYSYKLFIIVGVSTIIWVSVTFLTKPVNCDVLSKFVERVRPPLFGWSDIYMKYNIPIADSSYSTFVLCVLGIISVFCLCFGIGSIIFLSKLIGIVLSFFSLLLICVIVKKVGGF